MRILVTGSDGQLGQEFKNNACNSDHDFYFTDENELDITKKRKILDYVTIYKIELIINCAAYTNVNDAEINKRQVIKVNIDAVRNLVEVCEKKKIKMIHYSTDYVYNSDNLNPINEHSNISPINYYGISKREGEKIIENSSSESIIIRTSWLYSKYGNNFVNTILKKIDNREKICVVKDQFGCPTNAVDLASDTLKIIKSKIRLDKHGKVYNYSNLGYSTWSNFAKKIIEFMQIKYDIKEISSEDLDSKVMRPKYSVTSKNKIIKTFKLKIPTWEKSLKTYLTKFHL